MTTLLQDLKYGLRSYFKSFGFTLVALLTLALGIGASTAVFSVVNGILLKPLPYPDSEKIVFPWRLVPAGVNLGYSEIPWGMPHFQLFLRDAKTFQNLGAFKSDSFNLTSSGEPMLLEGLRASSGFFPALGVTPAFGRTFTPEEDQPGHDHVAILSHQLWLDRFSGDRGIVGRPIELNGDSYTVIGVMPAGFVFPRAEEMPGSFEFPREAQLWVPLPFPAGPLRGDEPDELAVVGRLRPGTTVAQAQAEMDVFAKRAEEQFPRAKGWFNSRLTPLRNQVVGNTSRPLLLLLLAVGVVLLIACFNVANLLLTRALGRRREFVLRAALGAGQGRLIRQLFTESFLLTLLGGLLGVVVAYAGIHFVKVLGPSNIPRLREVNLDLRVLAFLLGLTFVTGIFFGLAPAIRSGRENLVESLKEGGRRLASSSIRSRLRNTLLVGQVAFALVLIISAGLLVETFRHLLAVDGGFRADHVLTFELSLPPSKYPDQERMVALYQAVLQKLHALPGVQSAGIAETIPMNGAPESTMIRIPDHPTANNKERPFASYTIASPDYFAAVGIPILQGRDFLDSDKSDSAPVAIINQALARKYWPGENPLGRQIALGSSRYPPMIIVGIVADVKHLSLREEPSPEMYVPLTQKPWPSMLIMQVAVRTSDPASITGPVREAIHSVDGDLPLAKVAKLATLVDDSMSQPRFSMLLLTAFGAIALLLVAIGMYGVISYSVMQRTAEIGVRMALGAQRRNVFRMVLGEGARIAGLGIAIGIAVSLAVTRTMSRFLYGVQATDVLTFGGMALFLMGIALLACYLPARRATRVDPMIALRYE
jgi:putative ABC transport system permease protein